MRLWLGWLIIGILAVNRQLGQGSGDFHEFWDDAQRISQFGTAAQLHTTGWTYPPLFHALLAPFAYLPLSIAAILWYMLNSGCAFWALRRVPTLARYTCLPLVIYELIIGNVNILVMALILAGLEALSQTKEKRVGLYLGLAIALKLVPALLGLWLIWRARWRAASVMAGTVALSLVSMGPAFTVRWWQALRNPDAWFRSTLGFRAANESIVAVAHRWLSDIPIMAVGLPKQRTIFIAQWPENHLELLSQGLQGVGLCGLGLALGKPGPRSPSGIYWEAGMVLAISLLIAPLSWINYKLWLLPAWIALSERSPHKAWIFAIYLLMIVGVHPLMAAWGIPALAVLALIAALVYTKVHLCQG